MWLRRASTKSLSAPTSGWSLQLTMRSVIRLGTVLHGNQYLRDRVGRIQIRKVQEKWRLELTG